MTLPKTWLISVYRQDRTIEHHKRKAPTRAAVEENVAQEFDDDSVFALFVDGRLDKLRAELRDMRETTRKFPAFRHGARGGQFLYRHKGKRKRGRKNYPNRYWRRRLPPVTVTFIETISRPLSDTMRDWVKLITHPPVEPSASPFEVALAPAE